MTKKEFEKLTGNEEFLVCWKKGEEPRPFKLKNFKGNVAFGEFDRDDGRGVALHRVFWTALKIKNPEKPAVAESAMSDDTVRQILGLLSKVRPDLEININF